MMKILESVLLTIEKFTSFLYWVPIDQGTTFQFPNIIEPFLPLMNTKRNTSMHANINASSEASLEWVDNFRIGIRIDASNEIRGKFFIRLSLLCTALCAD